MDRERAWLKVGQKVYVKPIGNAARYKAEPHEAEIERLGSKYFYLKGFYREKFCKERLIDVSDFSSNFKVYETMQEIEDEKEASRIASAIGDIRYLGLTLVQLKAIEKIISERKQ